MNKRVMVFIVVQALMASAAFAEMGGMGGGGRGGHGMRGGGGDRASRQSSARAEVNTDNLREMLTFGNELELTDKQVEGIRRIRSESVIGTQAGYEALRRKQTELSDLLALPKPDFAAARAKTKEVNEAALNAQAVTINAYEKAYGLLTDGQKEKLAAIRERLKKQRDAEISSRDPAIPPE